MSDYGVENELAAGIPFPSKPSLLGQDNLARKAARSAKALGIRQFINYGANVSGGVILARLLPPAEFGFYAVVGLFLAFLNVFGGTGLAGNLIRTLEEPTDKSFRSVFAAQQISVSIVCVLVWIFSQWLAAHYHLNIHGAWFFRISALSLFLTSMMVIPQVKMERDLGFDKLAQVEVCQALSFNFVAILLAWRGFGILAFAGGLLARSLVGALLANVIAPWLPGWTWNFTELKCHLKFGLLLQSGQFLAMVKDSITPLFVGLYLGNTQMGYATWAMTFACYPSLLLMPMQRLYLPFFAKLQGDTVALARFVPKSLWIANIVAAPLAVLSLVLARPVTIIIFGEKWLIALPLFYCFSFVNLWAPINTPLMGLLNAIGKPQLTLWVIFLAMVAVWLLGVPMMFYLGLFGFGLAVALSAMVNLLLYWFVWRETKIVPWSSYWPAWPLAITVGVVVLLLQRLIVIHTLLVLFATFAAAMLMYFASLWFGFKKECSSWINLIKNTSAPVH